MTFSNGNRKRLMLLVAILVIVLELKCDANLLTGKTATQISTYSNFVASNGND